MSVTLRNTIPVLIVSLIGFFIMFSFPFDVPIFTQTTQVIGTWATLITSFAVGLGVINMMGFHAKNISRREKGRWIYSLCGLASLIFVAVMGLYFGVSSTNYRALYNIFIQAGSLSLVSLRGFFMFTALYRTYRVRSIEGGAMLLGTLITMTYQVPFQEMISPILPKFSEWMLNVPYVGGDRGTTMLCGIILTIMTLRLIAGIDRTWLGAEE